MSWGSLHMDFLSTLHRCSTDIKDCTAKGSSRIVSSVIFVCTENLSGTFALRWTLRKSHSYTNDYTTKTPHSEVDRISQPDDKLLSQYYLLKSNKSALFSRTIYPSDRLQNVDHGALFFTFWNPSELEKWATFSFYRPWSFQRTQHFFCGTSLHFVSEFTAFVTQSAPVLP